MVTPTPRLLAVALVGVPLAGLSGSYEASLTVGLGWLAVTILLAVADAQFSPAARDLQWSREHDPKLSLGAWNVVTLRVRNRSSRPVHLRARDVVPTWILPQGNTGEGMCPAGGAWELRYRVFPLHRGDYVLGPVAARCLGPLGLASRQRTVRLEDEVKVYPNLLALRSYEALVRRDRLQAIGLRNSRRWGDGTEFERLRDYTPDDEYRRVNWKATAKRGAPIVVDYQVERSQNVILALDTGRLMSTRLPLTLRHDAPEGVPALTRLDHAVNTSLLLAYVTQEYGDRTGLLAFSDSVSRYLHPRAGRQQFLAVTEALYNLESSVTETDYGDTLDYLAFRNPRRSLIVIFTDIADRDSAAVLVQHVTHLARRHLPLVVTLQDPAIRALAQAPPTDSDAVYARAVARKLLDDRETVLLELQQRGVLTLDVSAEKVSSSVINRYLEVKARGRL